MNEVFKSFCAFGAGNNAGNLLMDNSKFAKFARDVGLLDKKLTATDVDIIFSKIKTKTERKIRFEQFEQGLKLLAMKKYGAVEGSLEKLESKIIGSTRSTPSTSKTTKTVKAGAVDRLTDTSKYTGSHRERFDEDGKGKGLEGRYHTDPLTLQAMDGYVGAYKGKDTYGKTH